MENKSETAVRTLLYLTVLIVTAWAAHESRWTVDEKLLNSAVADNASNYKAVIYSLSLLNTKIN